MVSNAIVLEIRRLVAEGELTWTAIADRMNVSRTFVALVASGQRAERTARVVGKRAIAPTRCRECGGLVYKPCRLCRTRAHTRRWRLIQRITGIAPPEEPVPRRVA